MKTINTTDIKFEFGDARQLAFMNFSHLKHKDPRVVRRVMKVATRIYQSPELRFSQLFPASSEKEAAYRLIEHKKIDEDIFFKSIVSASFKKIESEMPKKIIVSQDTMVCSQNPKINVDGFGPVGSMDSSGLFLHTALWIDLNGVPRGVVSSEITIRDKQKLSKDHWKMAPIEKKESYKWLKVVENVCEQLPANTKAIFVSDRESDIHEYFELLIKRDADFVVRYSHPRRTLADNQFSKVKDELEQESSKTVIRTELPVKVGKETFVDKITLELTWKSVTIQPRKGGLVIHRNRKPFTLNCLKVSGKSSKGAKIEWVLYTSLPLENVNDALEILRIYKIRWRIEEFHLVLKSGMGIERTRFEFAKNISKFIALCVPMAMKILELQYYGRHEPESEAKLVFSVNHMKAIKAMIRRQNKRVPRKITIEMVIRLVAFCGGWTGRKRDGLPGVRAIWRGWRSVEEMSELIGYL